jgi:hypothetical protein
MDASVIRQTVFTLSCANLGIRSLTNPDIGSKVTTIAFQLYFVYNVFVNLLMHNNALQYHLIQGATQLALNQLLSYFIYDSVFLLSTKRGRAQWPYILHHIGSGYFLCLVLVYPDSSSTYLTNYGFLTLECANPLLNAMKLANYYMPDSSLASVLTTLTQVCYGVSRMVVYPWLIYEYADNEFVGKWYQAQLLTGHSVLYMCSAVWFWQLCAKTLRR